MKLYMNPTSATSRSVMLFAVENNIELDLQLIDLNVGEHRQPAYLEVNPNGLVPVLVDGNFHLGESSAILKYLADKTNSPLYPTDLRQRARVNEMMDWFNCNLYRDLGYNLVYPQLFPHHQRRSSEANDATVVWGQAKAGYWLGILDQHILGPGSNYVCLEQMTIADYFGVGLVTLGDAIGFDMSQYSNIDCWLDQMKNLKSWPDVNEEFYQMVEAFKGQEFVAA